MKPNLLALLSVATMLSPQKIFLPAQVSNNKSTHSSLPKCSAWVMSVGSDSAAGYTIMPNHVHATIAFRKTQKSINKIIGDGKRFIGYEIIKRLEEKGIITTLQQLSTAVNASDRKKGKKHEVWEDSFDWKECIGDDFTWQKLNYMHSNPCSGKWNLATSPSDYVHSSARFYLCGEQGRYPVLNFKELDDIDLSSSY